MLTYMIIGSLMYVIFLFNLPLLYNQGNGITYLKAMQTLILIPILGYLFFITVFRSLSVGTDYSMYYNFYVRGNYTEYFDSLIIFIYEVARNENNFHLFTLITTSLFISFNLFAVKRMSYNFFTGFTFFVLSFYFFYIFNGMRQSVAISVIFFGIYYVQKEKIKIKDFWLYLLFIYVAMQFHISAVFMLPVIFLRFFKSTKLVVGIVFLLTVVGYFSPFTKDIYTSLLMNFDFYTQKYEKNIDYFFSVNKEKNIVQFIPVLIQFFFLYFSLTLNQNKNVSNRFVTNYYLTFLFLYAGAGIEAIDRLQFYFYPSIILFYDQLIYSIYAYKLPKQHPKFITLNKVVVVVSISFWFLYFIIRVLQGTHGIVPYKMI